MFNKFIEYGLKKATTNPNENLSVANFLNNYTDKKVLMFGEQHKTGSVAYFTKEILPILIDKGFKSIVLEFFPYDFDSDAWATERNVIKTGGITPENTPKLFKLLNSCYEPTDAIRLIEYCLQQDIQLYGCLPDINSILESMPAITPTPPTTFVIKLGALNARQNELSHKLVESITNALNQVIERLNPDTKTIFYTGAAHNSLSGMTSAYEFVNTKFGRDNILSIRLLNPNKAPNVDIVYCEYELRNYEQDKPIFVISNSLWDFFVITEAPKDCLFKNKPVRENHQD
jgi:hypothetical protein